MYIFRLFDKADDLNPVDARLIQDGILRIGRDPSAEWVMSDPELEISRWHCEFRVQPEGLVLRCMGANGVFDDASSDRLPDGADIPVELPCKVRFGPYRLIADHAPQTATPGDATQTLIMSPPLGTSLAVPTDWSDPAPAADMASPGSLLDAFCDGAGLDASAFTAADPAEIMRRAGAVYRQMVLGVADLMAEREKILGQFELSRTTVGNAGNNPFKWAPSQRLAVDLLMESERGFLTGPAAVISSFQDIKKHLIATFAGFREALRTTVETFNPTRIAAATPRRPSLMKGRTAMKWEEACSRHSDLRDQIEGRSDGSLNRAFIKGYGAAQAEFEKADG